MMGQLRGDGPKPRQRLVAEFNPPVNAQALAAALQGWTGGGGNYPSLPCGPGLTHAPYVAVLAGNTPGHPLRIGLYIWEYPEPGED